jgi:hypothetical protein
VLAHHKDRAKCASGWAAAVIRATSSDNVDFTIQLGAEPPPRGVYVPIEERIMFGKA